MSQYAPTNPAPFAQQVNNGVADGMGLMNQYSPTTQAPYPLTYSQPVPPQGAMQYPTQAPVSVPTPQAQTYAQPAEVPSANPASSHNNLGYTPTSWHDANSHLK